MSKRLSPTRRLFNKYTELQEQMHVLVTHDGSDEAKVKLSRVERRFWPIQEELLRRLDERDELVVEVAMLRPAADAYRACVRWENASSYGTQEECASAWTEYLAATNRARAVTPGATP